MTRQMTRQETTMVDAFAASLKRPWTAADRQIPDQFAPLPDELPTAHWREVYVAAASAFSPFAPHARTGAA